jgi:hypothetical protein
MSDLILTHPMPTVDVKIKVDGQGIGNTRVYFDGVEVSELLMLEPFGIHFANVDHPETYMIVGLPIGELEVEMTDAALNLVGVDERTGEVA